MLQLQQDKTSHASLTKTELQTRSNTIDHIQKTTDSIISLRRNDILQKRKGFSATAGICSHCRQNVSSEHISTVKVGIEQEILSIEQKIEALIADRCHQNL